MRNCYFAMVVAMLLLLNVGSPLFGADGLNARWLDERAIAVTIPTTTQPAGTLGVWWFAQDGTLRATYALAVPDGATEVKVQLPADGRWAALSGGKIETFVFGTDVAAEVTVPAIDVGAARAGKPMANGKYVQTGIPPQRWFVDDSHALIWEGKPWIPVGGMFGGVLPLYHEKKPDVIALEWEDQHKTLDTIQSFGLNSLYVNMGYHAPVGERQRVLDDFNRRGITFGWQLAGGTSQEYAYQGYQIRRTAKQGLLIGTCTEPGKLAVRLPKARIFELLLVSTDVDTPTVQRFERTMDLADPKQQPAFIEIGVAKDATAKTVEAVVDIPDLRPGRYYVIVRSIVKAHLANIWGNTDKLMERHKYLAELNWGKGLRFFVDPTVNEEGFYNEAEPVRVFTEAFNRDFAGWLSKRYANVGELSASWRLPDGAVDSFDAAARLVPLRDGDAEWSRDKLLWIDPTTQKVIATRDGLGGGWFDYTDGARATYAACRDEMAKKLKQMVNVPIVYKQVSSWTAPETVNQTPGGFDGVGLEMYPGKGNLIAQTGAAGAMEARLGAQTMWLVCTELGYRPEVANGGIKNFPDEAYVDMLVRRSASLGAHGFMFFGFDLPPRDGWPNHQLASDPQQLKWLANASERLLADWPRPVALGQLYPEGQNWWWKSGGVPLTRYTGVFQTPPSNILRSFKILPDSPDGADAWVVSGSMPYPDAPFRVVNFASSEAAEHYGPAACKWIEAKEKVIYFGALPAAKNIRELSRHFANEQIQTPAGPAQVLNQLPGDVVLASHEGKVWAKRSGNLLIVSITKISEKPDGVERLPELNAEWVSDLLNAPAK